MPARRPRPALPKSAPTGPLPAPGEGKRGAGGHLAYLLRQAQAAVRAAGDRALADLGLSLPQFTILTLAGAYGALSGADLARLAVLTPQTVDSLVKALLRAGLVGRAPHPTHGRILTVTLTAAGITTLAAAKRRIGRLEARMAEGLGADAERAVRAWLAELPGRLGPAAG